MAGAAMMGNGSPNFMKNIGAGVAAGTQNLQAGMEGIDAAETGALFNAADFKRGRESDSLAQLQGDWQQRQQAIVIN